MKCEVTLKDPRDAAIFELNQATATGKQIANWPGIYLIHDHNYMIPEFTIISGQNAFPRWRRAASQAMDCEATREHASPTPHFQHNGTIDLGADYCVIYRSDADADVLADYVLALLRHDGDIEDVRKLCEEEIQDFLRDGRFTRAT